MSEREMSDNAAFLARTADLIRTLSRRVVRDAVAIGAHLAEVKAKCEYGQFGPEFQWSERTARNLVTLHELAKTAKFQLNLSVLHLVAAKSTPDEARKEILGRAARGEVVSFAAAREVVTQFKPVPRPAIISHSEGAHYTDSEFEKPPISPVIADIDDGTIQWLERKLENVLHLALAGYDPDEFFDFLVKAHSRVGGDAAFEAWLRKHGIAIAGDLSIEEKVMADLFRTRRAEPLKAKGKRK